MDCIVASSFVLLLSIIATYSRTSQLIVAGAFVVWALIAAVRRLAWRRLIVHVGVALAACVVALAASAVNQAAASKGLEFGGGVSVRQELIRAALAMLAQHPLGIGVFCFPLLYPSFRSTLEQDTAGLFVHNDYVQFLVEGGVPLLLFLLLFVGAGRASSGCAPSSRTDRPAIHRLGSGDRVTRRVCARDGELRLL